MRTWITRGLPDILARHPELTIRTLDAGAKRLHTVVALETSPKGAPIHTALAIFTASHEAENFRVKVEEGTLPLRPVRAKAA